MQRLQGLGGLYFVRVHVCMCVWGGWVGGRYMGMGGGHGEGKSACVCVGERQTNFNIGMSSH